MTKSLISKLPFCIDLTSNELVSPNKLCKFPKIGHSIATEEEVQILRADPKNLAK